MTLHDILRDITAAAAGLFSALAPAAFGSAVAQAWKSGLGWRDRLIQWVVGILVSYYVTMGLGAWFGFDPFMSQAVGFVLAMIAFETAPRLIRAAGEIVAEAPATIREWLLRGRGGGE